MLTPFGHRICTKFLKVIKLRALISLSLNQHFNTGCVNFLKNEKSEAVVTSDDGSIIVCWHPESCKPYEYTKEIPQNIEAATPLKHNLKDAKAQFKQDHPYFEIKKLQEITYTNKHIWYPRPERKMAKFKEKEPKDREYL